MRGTITVAKRFCGPPDSANGGYICGLLASYVPGDAEVTLRRPVPIDRDLEVVVPGPEEVGVPVLLCDGDTVLAEAAPTTIEIVVPEPVTVEAAHAVAGQARVLQSPESHPFPTCFTCGTDRAAGDGLRLFATPIPGRDVAAAVWEPAASVVGPDGRVPDEIVWSALDCPSGFAMYLEPELPPPYVLGRFAVHIDTPVRGGETYVASSWREKVDGRKLFAGSALRDRQGGLVAYSRATWVRLAS